MVINLYFGLGVTITDSAWVWAFTFSQSKVFCPRRRKRSVLARVDGIDAILLSIRFLEGKIGLRLTFSTGRNRRDVLFRQFFSCGARTTRGNMLVIGGCLRWK